MLCRGWSIVCALALASIGNAQETLDPASYARWRDYLLPSTAELGWKDVAWRSTLWEAVHEAHDVQKPILLWAMNGHPQGCT